MASPDRMEVDENSSDGESFDEVNPEEMSDKKTRLAWARALTWDASVADDRDRFSVDELPDDDDRRDTAALIADIQTLRQLSQTRVADGFRFPEGLSSRSPGSGATWAICYYRTGRPILATWSPWAPRASAPGALWRTA